MLGVIAKKYVFIFVEQFDLGQKLNQYAELFSCNTVFLTDNFDNVVSYYINGKQQMNCQLEPNQTLNYYICHTSSVSPKLPEKGESLTDYGKEINYNWTDFGKFKTYNDSLHAISELTS